MAGYGALSMGFSWAFPMLAYLGSKYYLTSYLMISMGVTDTFVFLTKYMILDTDLDNGFRALEEDVSIAKRKVTTQLRLEWTNSEMGQSNGNAVDVSSAGNEPGQNNLLTKFVDPFYSTLVNPSFDPFLDLDDAEVVAKVSEVEQTLESEHSEEEEDNDYIVNVSDIDELEVDMEDFHAKLEEKLRDMH
ncbi:hypothetical protein Tco_0534353 [Tanacetum coccineum]